MTIKRREFLQMGSLATGSFFLPRFLQAFEGKDRLPGGPKVLVVLQLSGGNDGLNTVIPVRNDIYFRERPMLGITREKALTLTDEAGLHPALPAFKSLYDEGNLAILNAVGYPDPDRSHFRSMDIWQSGSGSSEIVNTGWLGRWLDQACVSCDKPTQGVEIDDVLSLALSGEKMKGIAFRDPKRLYDNSRDPYYRSVLSAGGPGHSHASQTQAYLYQVMAETLSGADYIFAQSRLRPSQQAYPDTEIGKNLHTIASLIASDINTRVYYVSLGSFDTHAGQAARQEKLFGDLNAAIAAFTADLKACNRFGDTLLLTFSEFGRRVSQNASGGTDHGTANNMFLIGGGLRRKGLLNALPDLGDLADDDLKYQVDFRQVYATVLAQWLQADPKSILGHSFAPMDFI